MAFGLLHWLTSFTIFFVVLGVITWSALHLGGINLKKKDHELPKLRFVNMKNDLNRRESKSLNSTIIVNATSSPTESANNTTPFMDHEGLEVSNSAQFYRMLQVLSGAKERAISSTQDDFAGNAVTAILTSSILAHDSALNEDVTAAAYNMSAESAAVDHHWSIGEEVVKSSTRIPQTAYSTVPQEYLDTERSRKSDSYPSDKTKFSDLPHDKGNGTSNVSTAFSLVQLLPGVNQTSTVKHAEKTDMMRVAQNERLEIETSTINPYFYVTVYTTEDP